jgi:hypothetical protein
MFLVSEEERAAIRQAFEAVVELRRHFRIDRNEDALFAVRSIVAWRPTLIPPSRRPRGRSAG